MYRKSVKICLIATAAAALLRILLKILYVDTETGFYAGGGAFVWLLAGVMAAGAAGIAAFAMLEKEDAAVSLRGNRFIEAASALFGVAAAATSVPKLLSALAMDPLEPAINRLPMWMLIVENLLGIASGAVLLYITFCFFSGSRRSGMQGMAALVPVVWHAVLMIERYISFRQVNTASDQFIETMYLVSATMFLLASTRCLAATAKSCRACVIWGLLAAHFGLVLIAGQTAAVAVLGGDISGPPMLQNALILTLSLYALAIAASIARPAAKE